MLNGCQFNFLLLCLKGAKVVLIKQVYYVSLDKTGLLKNDVDGHVRTTEMGFLNSMVFLPQALTKKSGNIVTVRDSVRLICTKIKKEVERDVKFSRKFSLLRIQRVYSCVCLLLVSQWGEKVQG